MSDTSFCVQLYPMFCLFRYNLIYKDWTPNEINSQAGLLSLNRARTISSSLPLARMALYKLFCVNVDKWTVDNLLLWLYWKDVQRLFVVIQIWNRQVVPRVYRDAGRWRHQLAHRRFSGKIWWDIFDVNDQSGCYGNRFIINLYVKQSSLELWDTESDIDILPYLERF